MIHTHALRQLPPAVCPACGRSAIDLGDQLYHCPSCGKVGTERVGMKDFVQIDAAGGVGIGREPNRPMDIRWTCGVIPGCSHDTEADANAHIRGHR